MSGPVFAVATDGSCWPTDGGPGGWAAVVVTPDGTTRELTGGAASTTANRMELTAAIEALEALPAGARVCVESDSQYVVRGMTERVGRWAERGWRTSAGGRVKNRPLWERLIAVASRLKVEWRWIKGHSGHALNERADQLAGEQRALFTPTTQASSSTTASATTSPASIQTQTSALVVPTVPLSVAAASAPATTAPVSATTAQASSSSMSVRFGGRVIPVRAWRGEKLRSPLGLDTETASITDDHVVPELVIAAVFDGETAYIIRRESVGRFLVMHADHEIIAHNAAFDFWVLERWFSSTKDAAALDALWRIADGRLHDTMLLDRLLRLADRRTASTVAKSRSLAVLVRELLDERLPKDDDVRLAFGAALVNEQIELSRITPAMLLYAATDPVATLDVWSILQPRAEAAAAAHGERLLPDAQERFGGLSETVQVRGAIALAAIGRRGLLVDRDRLVALREQLQAERDRLGALLEAEGVVIRKATKWKKKQAGLHARLRRVVEELRDDDGRRLIESTPTTPKGHVSTSRDAWGEWRSLSPFLDAFLTFDEVTKLLSTFVRGLGDNDVVRSRYNVLVRTGRTSASKPNVQNLPRKGGVREVFRPRPGFVYLVTDYRFIELVTLAQTALMRFGSSRLGDVINSGQDPHRITAAQITGKQVGEIDDQERQWAKAANFGFPGGLGAEAFIAYARSTYGVTVTKEQAAAFRAAWIAAYPEMGRWLASDDMATLARNLGLERDDVCEVFREWSVAGTSSWIPPTVARIVSGHSLAKGTGEPYRDSTVSRAWELLSRGRLPAELAWRVANRVPSAQLADHLRRVDAVTLTGRVRAACSYTQARNAPFQGLAADGAKLAMFDLERAGYAIVAFVHDEIVLEIAERSDYSDVVHDVSIRMVNAMRVVCPDVRVEVEPVVSRSWSKDKSLGVVWSPAAT